MLYYKLCLNYDYLSSSSYKENDIRYLRYGTVYLSIYFAGACSKIPTNDETFSVTHTHSRRTNFLNMYRSF